MRMRILSLLVVLPLLAVSTAESASIAVRFGRIMPRISSPLWEENFATFTIVESDFDGIIGGAEFGVELSEFVDLTFGVEGSSRTVFSSYQEFVRDDGSEIVQDFTLRIVPMTAGVRFMPIGKFQTLVPYVGGGAGFYYYEYIEDGEFIDFTDFDIFGDVFVDRGVACGLYGNAGLELRLSSSAFVFGEYRYHWAQGEHREDFRGFGSFDLTGSQVTFGVNFRF